MAQQHDTIVERAQRVEHTLHSVGDSTAQVAVGGPCPDCGTRVETVLRTDSTHVSCHNCGNDFRVAA